jgi:hypothetical protein
MNILDLDEANDVVTVRVDEASQFDSTSAFKLGGLLLIVKFVIVLALFMFQLTSAFFELTDNVDLNLNVGMNNSVEFLHVDQYLAKFDLAESPGIASPLNWNADGTDEFVMSPTNHKS